MRITFYIIFLFGVSVLSGQSFIFPQDIFFDAENQEKLFSDSLSYEFHPSLQPLNNAYGVYERRNADLSKTGRKWFGRKLFNEDLVELKHTDTETGKDRVFTLNISPLFNLQAGQDLNDTSGEQLYVNSRGVLVKGSVGEKFRFESAFLENQAMLPRYQDDFAQYYGVIPGNGRWKTFNKTGYDYAMASGYISWMPCRFFSLWLGHGKNKVGHGYRSLLLSDNSFTYPSVRLTHSWWKGRIQYTNIYAVLMNLSDGGVPAPPNTERLFQKKPAAFHHLSLNPSKYFSLGFFQSLIWNHPDSTNRQEMGPAYFNPVIFSNLAAYGLQDNKNIMMGMDLAIMPVKDLVVYGQLAIDELGAATSISNKMAYQAGIKYYDAFTLKNLFIQVEYNSARPFMYSATDPAQSYTHYGQALAHPLGANFTEWVALLSYRYKRFFVQGKINLAEQGLNAGNNYGQDIFASDFAPALNTQNQNQGIPAGTTLLDGRVGYLFNPKTNFNICIGGLIREFTWKASSLTSPPATHYFYVSIRTSLYNQYWDF